ncbi:unnamed protein product [Owenia fusiformis]|uniref:Uncharacterized protein n=1 Tax=Owenia fusiformis TaxID=6347 RepID=A0A8S4NPZ9_OWEFU|nr:unnamed protein product [Owenia fusiformis]
MPHNRGETSYEGKDNIIFYQQWENHSMFKSREQGEVIPGRTLIFQSQPPPESRVKQQNRPYNIAAICVVVCAVLAIVLVTVISLTRSEGWKENPTIDKDNISTTSSGIHEITTTS